MSASLEPTDGLLAAELVVLIGIRVGHARLSAGGRKPGRPPDALNAAGCRGVLAGRKSDEDTGAGPVAALDFARAGDTLVVPSPGGLCRSPQELIAIVGELRDLRELRTSRVPHRTEGGTA